MARLALSSKKAFILFISITVILIAQAVWWIVLMARLLDEKVEIAEQWGASKEFLQKIQEEEISRQMMVGMEGVFFLLLVGFGAYLIYRALVKNEELKFHQQNFLMAVTHELKTPLASMKIYLDTLKSDKISEEKKLNIIPRIKDDVNRLEKLIENILEAGRFEKSGYQLNRQEFNLSQLIEECLNKLQSYSHKREMEINKNTFCENLFYNGDPYALSRAIDAVLENCVKYNDKDKILIDFELKEENKSIKINIKDNGIGLEKKDIHQIFERFYQVAPELNRSNTGSGLGLYLCKEIIKAHKGSIEAISEGIGQGVEFKIHLKANMKNENSPIS